MIKQLVGKGHPDKFLSTLIKNSEINFEIDDALLAYLRQRRYLLTIQALEASRVASGDSRVKISISPYQYDVDCKDFASHYTEFADILNAKAINLAAMFTKRDPAYSYINRLGVEMIDTELKDLKDFKDYWAQHPRSLQLLRGRCFGDSQGKSVSMVSQVFLGDLGGPMRSPMLSAEFRPSKAEIQHTTDIHSLLILYSLAQDGPHHNLPDNLVLQYLTEAKSIIVHLENTEYADTIRPIKEAVMKILQSSNQTAEVN